MAAYIPPAAMSATWMGGMTGFRPGSPGQAQDSPEAEVVDVMADHILVGAVLPVPGDGAIDQPFVQFFHLPVPDSQAIRDPRAEPLEDHIRFPGHSIKNFQPLGMFQV